MLNKVMPLRDAIAKHVKSGQKLYIGGFTHCVPYAAVHELIRQGINDLEICKMVPELLLDQLIAAGVCKKIIFGWAGNPGLGNLRVLRGACEKGQPYPVEIEEYTHMGLFSRLYAGAVGLPFMILRSGLGTDLPKVNPSIRELTCPYTGERLNTVPAYNADVAILHAQRADREGNVQMWGVIGEQKEAAFGAKKVIVTAEEIVERETLRAEPNKTVLPGCVVHAVCHVPWGAHPSYVYDYYDRDNEFYVEWNRQTANPEFIGSYLQEWVYALDGREAYLRKLPRTERLKAGDSYVV